MPSALLHGLMEHGPTFLRENFVTMAVSAVMTLLTIYLTKLCGTDTEEPPMKPSQKNDQPRPKWEVLSVLNYFFVTVFIGSLTFTAVNYQRYFTGNTMDGESSAHKIFPMLVLWCICMVYFFGFFGISFLDKSSMTPSSSSFNLEEYGEEAKQGPSADNRTRREMPNLAPMHDTPICAEKGYRALSQHPLPTQPAPSLLSPAELTAMSDEQLLGCISSGALKDHELEKRLKDCERAVRVRRAMYERRMGKKITGLPFEGYDYEKIFGANCEIVVGYVPVPVGLVGPILLDDKPVFVPMATTEGCLVASTNRGCKAITESGGAISVVLKDGMSRAPLIRMPTAWQAAEIKAFVETEEGFALIKDAFESTTSFGKLKTVAPTVAGRNCFLRFVCITGDAMGMNMISKGCLKVMELLGTKFPEMQLVSISGNMCTDKKPAAINWIEGRGKSVVVEAVIPGKVVQKVLKTTVKHIVEVNKQKNLVGSAMAGSIGGFNAHAANIVSAVFLATGQDIAQNIESSNCITLLEEVDGGENLHISVTMPSIEVGTVGGGTHLEAQGACLDILGVRGASKAPKQPGDNAQQLARAVASAVMAGELSLLAALAANHLVKSHMQHNRKAPPPSSTPSTTTTTTTSSSAAGAPEAAPMENLAPAASVSSTSAPPSSSSS